MSKKRLFLLGLVLFCIMFISGIYSLSDEVKKTESGLSTSAVEVEIEEYNQNDDSFSDNGKIVMPGDEIVLKPKINNLGIECYLRVKITYSVGDLSFNVLDYIEGNYSSWTKDGDYYYYDSIFGVSDSIELFNKVLIPDVPSSYQKKSIVIDIVVDSIQAKNFDGNWNGITIKKSVNRTYNIDYEGDSSIIYEDNSSHYVTLDNKFFDNLGSMLPGDNISENIIVDNNDDNKKEFFLAIDYDELTEDEVQLLKSMKLIIKKSNGEKLIVSDLASKEKHSLGVYIPFTGDTLTIEVSLPIDVDNDCSKLFTKVMWKFSYDIIREENNPLNPYTWDLKFDLSITVFLISAIGLLVVMILGKYSTNNIEIDKNGKRN